MAELLEVHFASISLPIEVCVDVVRVVVHSTDHTPRKHLVWPVEVIVELFIWFCVRVLPNVLSPSRSFSRSLAHCTHIVCGGDDTLLAARCCLLLR